MKWKVLFFLLLFLSSTTYGMIHWFTEDGAVDWKLRALTAEKRLAEVELKLSSARQENKFLHLRLEKKSADDALEDYIDELTDFLISQMFPEVED